MTAHQKHRRSLADIIKAHEPTPPSQDTFWNNLNIRIHEGTVIPILSNAVLGNRIFNVATNGDAEAEALAAAEPAPPAPVPITFTVDEELAGIWADNIHYPLPDKYNLTRVAQYNRVKSQDAKQAKINYLQFIKGCLLNLAESLDENAHDLVAELRTQLNERTFTDLASDLGFPSYAQPDDDPVRLLARLNLPIYVTTSYYDFMERALRAEGREPHTEICFWHPDMAPDRPKSDFIPSPEKPVVYHLHGYEDEPITLVLSEDDYLDFLMGIAQDTDVVSRVIPLYLRTALAQSTLLLLGYRIQDWDFRTLFRGLITAKTSPLRDFSVALQLKLSEQEGVTNPDEAQKYLEEYFRPTKFNVIWNEADSFIHELWQQWNQWRQG